MTTLLLALLVGCPDNAGETGKPGGNDQDDSADSGDTSGDTCEVQILEVSPEDGETGVYYREVLTATFDNGDQGDVTFAIADAAGNTVTPDDVTWAEGDTMASLSVVLSPDTTYTFTTTACGVGLATTFTTDSLGEPLEIPPEDLIGRTYMFRLSDADITEPAFLDVVASTYLVVPLLFGVTSASDTEIDLLGALGYHESDGSYTQIDELATWDFPAADFSEAPYFEAQAEAITIMYVDIAIPIENFHLAGTFSADGSAIEHGTASGLGDSRYMGSLIGQDDEPGAICELAEGAGVYCTECSDGEPYCLYIVAEDITADYIPGLTVTPYP